MSPGFWAGVAAGYGIAVPVGAIGVLIASLSARTSLRIGLAAGLGAATADGLYALVAVVGGVAVAGVVAPIATPLRWAAAVVLLALAAITLRSAFRRPSAAASMAGALTALRAYLGVLGLTLLNPATVVYFVALVLGRGVAGGGGWFVLGVFIASVSWQFVVAGSGALLGRVLTSADGHRLTALISSLIIAVLAISLLC